MQDRTDETGFHQLRLTKGFVALKTLGEKKRKRKAGLAEMSFYYLPHIMFTKKCCSYHVLGRFPCILKLEELSGGQSLAPGD